MAIERAEYDEFGLFAENAAEFGLPYDGPPTVRREFVAVDGDRKLSALGVGHEPARARAAPRRRPERPHVGHRGPGARPAAGRHRPARPRPLRRRQGGPVDLADNAADVAVAIRALAPDAKAVVGMSLGGMTTIELARQAPELVRSMVLVDITPGVTAEKAKAITDFVNGPATFPSFDDLLARTMEHNPTRTSRRCGGASCTTPCSSTTAGGCGATPATARLGAERRRRREAGADRTDLWDVIAAIQVPLLLVRGMRPQSVVDDKDEAELQRAQPAATVVHVQEAGHSVQGDTPSSWPESSRFVP